MMDPFAQESHEYSPNKFYTRAVDKQGHKETLHVPVPPAIYAAVSELIASRKFPALRTPQDFVRDAIIHRLHYLSTMAGGDYDDIVARETFLADVQRLKSEATELEQLLLQTEELLKIAQSTADDQLFDTAIEHAMDRADSIREPYRTRLHQLVGRFRH
ncbi:MAG: hypothetical protein KatS3mg015_2913 [Fimbriimonadales bacterium]|nr:MAG: hypothetical protein KatS3mg015_2913 [Fimbriimonadales bacterium]